MQALRTSGTDLSMSLSHVSTSLPILTPSSVLVTSFGRVTTVLRPPCLSSESEVH